MKELLLIIKLDATNLYNRITQRKKESLHDFSLKRERQVFEELFFTRYYTIKANELSQFDGELIQTIDQFYTLVDELKWYLHHTQDMINKIEDTYMLMLKQISPNYQSLLLYINATLQ